VAAVHESLSRRLFEDAVALLTPSLCASRRWRVVEASYPILDVEFNAPGRTTMRVHLTCEGWNGQAPSAALLAADGTALTQPPTTPRGQFNHSPHPTTGRPFVCMVGTREYHTHPSHLGDLWDNYRERPAYDLGGIVTQLWRAWQEARP
jgi:hypothetical protein